MNTIRGIPGSSSTRAAVSCIGDSLAFERKKIRTAVSDIPSVRSFSKHQPSSILNDAWPRLEKQFRAESAVEERHGCTKQPVFPLSRTLNRKQMAKFFNTSSDEAAVLVLLCSVAGVPSLLLTRRASHLRTHAAEIAFVGGHFDSNVDDSLEDTALREAVEELRPTSAFSHFRDHVSVLGQATTIPSIQGTPVTPILAVFWPDLPRGGISHVFPGDPVEVDAVFTIPLQTLFDRETTRQLPGGGRFGMTHAPVFPTDCYGNIWGLTALIMRPVLHRLFKPVFELRRTQGN